MATSRSRVPTTRKQSPQSSQQPERGTPPPGTIGIVSGDLGRFTEFATSMMRLVRPPDTRIMWVQGLDVTANYNKMIEALEGEWFWIMGDDHIFDPLLLIQLLMHDLDVVVPLCLERQAPFKPVVYSGEDGFQDGFPVFTVAQLPQTGVHEVHAAGTAGMLIRKHVLDALEKPIFRTSGVHQNEDLNLCQKIREAGFKIHCDVDSRLGHIGVFGVFPFWVGDRFGTLLRSGETFIPLYPHE
jgi:hypothetical protein